MTPGNYSNYNPEESGSDPEIPIFGRELHFQGQTPMGWRLPPTSATIKGFFAAVAHS
jgi:hypothetical protein